MIGWYDIGSVQDYCFKVSKRTVETWISNDGLRVVRIRGKRFIKREWLDEFLEAHEVTNSDKKVDSIVDEVMESIQT
jgi:excisionase family DNA binding protein